MSPDPIFDEPWPANPVRYCGKGFYATDGTVHDCNRVENHLEPHQVWGSHDNGALRILWTEGFDGEVARPGETTE
jgi:hypothetical protein